MILHGRGLFTISPHIRGCDAGPGGTQVGGERQALRYN